MATKRSPKPVLEETYAQVQETEIKKPSRKVSKKLVIGVLVVAALMGFWYKTNSWPIVAFVGLRPITRFEVYKSMYQSAGESTIDTLITEQLVKKDLAKRGINASNQEIDNEINKIRTSLGENVKLEDLVAQRGLTMNEVREQIKMQLDVEKAVGDRVNVTNEEIDKFVKDNEQYLTGSTSALKRAEAEKTLKEQKTQGEISKWIEELRNGTKVIRIDSTGK